MILEPVFQSGIHPRLPARTTGSEPLHYIRRQADSDTYFGRFYFGATDLAHRPKRFIGGFIGVVIRRDAGLDGGLLLGRIELDPATITQLQRLGHSA